MIYSDQLALLTDLYQITMAYGYWKTGRVGDNAVFHLFYRTAPFHGEYAIACGLERVVEYLRHFRFEADDLEYLSLLTGNNGHPLFDSDFLDFLGALEFQCDLAAMPEGTIVFAHEPILRVKGPLIQCQLLETPLLNIINFQTLCATKASRICAAAEGEPVLEFGLRRAQGIDGALAASRAAYVGGCAATSNVLAGKLYGIPVKGTHAHSWVMSFDSEEEAFSRYAEAMPNNCVFLVDTYNTIEGVEHAVAMGKKLRERGHELVGIRLDSGDMAKLSQKARDMLDQGGFPDAKIVASNELDEHAIAELKRRGARIGVWGVGTKLVTAYDQPALGGVYKLSAIQRVGGAWEDRMKLTEERIKVSTPGMQQVRRYLDAGGRWIGDGIYDVRRPPGESALYMDVMDSGSQMSVGPDDCFQDLLVPVFEQGRCVYSVPGLEDVRALCTKQVGSLPPAVRNMAQPESYFVGLEENLARRKTQLIAEREGERR